VHSNTYINSSRSIGLYKRKNMRIGLLGGSFNPAHRGHIYISNMAIKLFKLHEVWWMINPQNPLKSSKSTAPLKERINYARNLIVGNRIKVQSLEDRYYTKYTYHTIKKLLQCQPGNKFIWLMGADNLSQINLWINWNKIFDIIPIAVFNREGYSRTVISSVAANYYNQSLYNKQNLSKIFKRELPVWVFIRLRKLPYSSTEIRYNRKEEQLI